MTRNPYAKALRTRRPQVIPDKRVDAAIRAMRAEYEQEIERLREEDPDWVKELLARLK